MLMGPARSVTARRAVVTRINNRRDPPGAMTKRQKTTITKRTTSPAAKSFRRPRTPCASMVAPRCMFLTASLNSGRERLLRQSHHPVPKSR